MDLMALKEQNRSRNLEEARAGAIRLASRPLWFWFDLCGRCSLKCKHCAVQVHGRTSNDDVSEEVYETVLAEIMPTASVCQLGGTNYGEMTIARHFHRFLKDCQTYHVNVGLTTNGTRMDDEWFDDLIDRLVEIGFSLEGIGEQFENIRRFQWKTFLANVEKVCRRRDETNRTFRIEWRYCAHADSIHQLPEMIRLAKGIGVNRIQVMNLVPYVPAQKHKQLTYHRTLANRMFDEARRVAEPLAFDISIPPDFKVGTFDVDTPVEPVGSNGQVTLNRCYLPWQTCSINEMGIVRPCCTYWKPMGCINGRTFESVWNGRPYRRLRARINAKSDLICYSCRRPRFDSEDNTAALQLQPSLKQILRAGLAQLRSKRNVTYTGALPADDIP